MERVEGYLDRLPVLDDILFWLLVVTGLLLFAGITGIAFGVRSFVFSIAAFFGFAVYAALAWRRWKKKPLPTLEFLVPALSALFDLLITGGITAYSAILIVSNVVLSYLAYQAYRDGRLIRRPGTATSGQPKS